MAKKIFVRARLVTSARWYVDFYRYDPATGEETRHRRDFDLNEIDNLEIRRAVGERLVRNIELFAPDKPPATVVDTSPSGSLKGAILQAVAEKQLLPRQSSRRRYVTVSKPLLLWIHKNKFDHLPPAEFSRKHARAYWDTLTASKKYRGKTLNNYLDGLRTLWNVLNDRELVEANPWERIKPTREEEKKRRNFTDEERRTVAAAALASDYWLFRGILLQFYLYIRPVELTRLQFRDFDFAAGTVTIEEADAKQYRKASKTIPVSIRPYFLDGRFDRYPANYFVFGRVGEHGRAHIEPSTTALDDQRLYKRHARLLASLKAAGKLTGDISGLSWYSWKDTGISLHARKTGPVPTKEQAGHRSLSVTSFYYHDAEKNTEYSELENDLFL